MIHFLPEPDAFDVAPPADALARVAGLAQALAAAEGLSGHVGEAADQTVLAAAWPTATEAQHALFDAMSAHAVAGSVAGLEVIGALRDAGLEANRAAIDTLTASIRSELDRLGTLLTL
ncbi:hypothetical protein [Sphingomonas sp.]|uniref:hypothetical protein n=1 Tax=Sphingomonas sp. TaxID=28214 RepID=UPI00286B452B|nr:hypothetical protein [Sphingomonas sp.]